MKPPRVVPPYAKAKPNAQYVIAPTEKSIKFFITMFTEFFDLVKPVSTSMKPGCINITKIPAMRTHRLSTEFIIIDSIYLLLSKTQFNMGT
jgi:hypothetical protein